MKDIMIKSVGALALCLLIVLACSRNGLGVKNLNGQPTLIQSFFGIDKFRDDVNTKRNPDNTLSVSQTDSLYGAYLAGRVAHMRQDFSTAAEYYRIAGDKDSSNPNINRTIYVILSSLGQINEALPYARKEIENGNRASLAPLIVAIKEFNDGLYEDSLKSMADLKDNVHVNLVTPLFSAWAYAGLEDEQKAIASIDAVAKDPALNTLKLFHKGMIYDYLGNKQQAAVQFETIVKKYPKDVTYRILEVITDFYVRSGDKQMAHRISNHYNDNGLL
ncbi:MAG: hypothetical protein J6039_03035, partial [Alphaproteobacteria bacterium]|nr:hypothetical protein [Alphaproteobacteria bacterium]